MAGQSGDVKCTSHAGVHCLKCNDGYDLKEKRCVIKVCKCTSGQGATGSSCPKAGNSVCASCKDGYHLNAGTKACDVNQCSCQNGVGAKGAECTKRGSSGNVTSLHGSAKCVSCSSKFFLANAACSTCSTCKSGKYQASACAKTADTVCATCSPVQNGAAGANVTCTSASDSQIASCASSYYLVKEKGKADTCVKCKRCRTGSYYGSRCSGAADAICGKCTPVGWLRGHPGK